VTNTIQTGTSERRALLDPTAASQFLGISKSFLDKRRVRGDGPPYRKIGRRVFYWRSELEQWVDQSARTSTSATGGQP
jgi:predicted DNA-binding transcriptional regulator AlpA